MIAISGVIVPFAAGWGLSNAWGMPSTEAIFVGAALTDGKYDVMMFSSEGKAIRFPVSDVRVFKGRGGKDCLTEFRTLERFGRFAFVECRPLTGRTHQLRVHCAEMGCPILGDGKYGGKNAHPDIADAPKQLQLHARSIALRRPNGRTLKVEAPLPAHMKATWAAFGFSARPDSDPFVVR